MDLIIARHFDYFNNDKSIMLENIHYHNDMK